MFGFADLSVFIFGLFLVVPILLFLNKFRNRQNIYFSHFILNRISLKKSRITNLFIIIIRLLLITLLILFFASFFKKKNGVLLKKQHIYVIADNNYHVDIQDLNKKVNNVSHNLGQNDFLLTIVYFNKFKIDSMSYDGKDLVIEKSSVGSSQKLRSFIKKASKNSRIVYIGNNSGYLSLDNIFLRAKETTPLIDSLFFRSDTLYIHSSFGFSLYNKDGSMVKSSGKNAFFLKSDGEYRIKFGETEEFVFYLYSRKKRSVAICGDDYDRIMFLRKLLSPVFHVDVYSSVRNIGKEDDFGILISNKMAINSSIPLYVFPQTKDSVEFFYYNKFCRSDGEFLGRLGDISSIGKRKVDIGFNIKRLLHYRVKGARRFWVYKNNPLAYKKGNIRYFTFDIDTSNSDFVYNPLFLDLFDNYLNKKEIRFYCASDILETPFTSRFVRLRDTLLKGEYVAGKEMVSSVYESGYMYNEKRKDSIYINNNLLSMNNSFHNIEKGVYVLDRPNEIKNLYGFKDLGNYLLVIILFLFGLDTYLTMRKK